MYLIHWLVVKKSNHTAHSKYNYISVLLLQLFDNWIKPSDEGTKATPDIVIIGFGIDDMVNANDTEEGLHDYLSDLAFLTQVHFLSVHEIQSIS